MAKQIFCQISVEKLEYPDHYLLTELTNAGKDGIDLTVSDGRHAWGCQLSDDDLENLRSAFATSKKYSEYVQETVQALTGVSKGAFSFTYQLNDVENGVKEFVWKRHVPAEGIKILLGKARLTPIIDTVAMHQKIFTHCIENEKTYSDRVTSLEKENHRLSEECETALTRYEECVVAKESLEQDLYSKFVAVLNSKKEKIRELKEQLESGTVQGESLQSHASKQEPKSPPVKHHISTDSGGNTDEEMTPSPKKQPKQSCLNKGGDSKLILDDDEDDGVIAPTSSRRRRAVGTKPLTTPSKPTLPRVGSSATKSRPDSIRKSNSRKTSSQKSSDNCDPDELLGDL